MIFVDIGAGNAHKYGGGTALGDTGARVPGRVADQPGMITNLLYSIKSKFAASFRDGSQHV